MKKKDYKVYKLVLMNKKSLEDGKIGIYVGCTSLDYKDRYNKYSGDVRKFIDKYDIKFSEANYYTVCKPENEFYAHVTEEFFINFFYKHYIDKSVDVENGKILHYELLNKASNGRGVKRPVICLTDGQVFDSIANAAKHYGVNSSSIYSACMKIRHINKVKGLEFQFISR